MKRRQKRKNGTEQFDEEEFNKQEKEGFQQLMEEGPILASRADNDRCLVMPFVTMGMRNNSGDIHQVFVSVLRKLRFTGFCHAFDRSLPEAWHHLTAIAFSYECDGEPYDIFEEIWPIVLTQFALEPHLRIRPKASEFRSLGYVRQKMHPSGSVLFYDGVPNVAPGGHSPFADICCKEFLRTGEGCSGDFFRDPMDLWGYSLGGELPPEALRSDPDDIPF